MANGIYYLYLIIVIPLALVLAAKADHRPLVAIFLLWLLGTPALVQEGIMIRIAPLGLDLQPTRIVLLTLLPAVVMNRLSPEIVRKRSFAPLAPFEKILIAYVVISILAVAANFESLGQRQIINIAEKQLAFGVLYFSARDYLTRSDYQVLVRGITLLAIFSSLVAILQSVYDPQFFRVAGIFKGAFGDVGRSSGAFGAEYDHAMYVTFVTIILGLRDQGRPMWQWTFLAIIFGISVVVTFTRMPWAVFLFAVLGVLIIRYWYIPLWRRLGIVMTGIVLALVVGVPWLEVLAPYLPEKLVTGRLMVDTMSARLAYNNLALSLLPKYPWGLGATVESPIYNLEWLNFGLESSAKGVGFTIHNGFLSAAVRYGIAGGLAFGFMLFGCLVFSVRRAVASNFETFILPLIVAVLILYNLTLDFSSGSAQTFLMVGWLMGYFVGQNLYRSSNNNRTPYLRVPRNRKSEVTGCSIGK